MTIAPSYVDKNRIVYVLACIDRGKALAVYDARIRNNVTLIDDLLRRYENAPNPFRAIRKLRDARNIAELAAGYADMAALVNSAVARYGSVSALVSRIDRAIENSRQRLTISITPNGDSARTIARKIAEIMGRAGFLLVDSAGTYQAVVNLEMNEGVTKNYYTVQPELDISVQFENGEAVARFQKNTRYFAI